jgi:hypothetical protein
MKTHGRLAALGALGVAAGSLLLWLLLAFISRRTETGGMDFDHTMVTWVSTAVLFLAVIAVHVAFALQLFAYVKEHGEP